MCICALHDIDAHHRADQHEQCRFRQVEIRDQSIRDPESITRCNEDVCRRVEGDQDTRGGCALQRTQGRGADWDAASARSPRSADRSGGLGQNLGMLGMHPVFADLLRLNRQEGPGIDMKGNVRALYALGAKPVEEVRREMQARRWRRDRPGLVGEHRLVVAGISLVSSPLRGNIGRNGHLTRRFECGIQLGARAVEGQMDLCIGLARHLRA